MSTNEPPVEPPVPPAGQYGAPQPPPPAYGQYPTGQTPGQAPGYGAPGPATPGVPRPGELLDRFLARLIDGVLLGIVYGVFSAILTAIFVSGYRSSGEAIIYFLFLSILTTAASLAYYGYFESTQGATLGKQLLKLKVVGPSGTGNPTLEEAIKRNIFMAFSLAGIIPVVGSALGGLASLVAVIMIAVGINSDTVARQGWHDKFAGGTRVLKVG